MGTMLHHALIVTSYSRTKMLEAWEEAIHLKCEPSPIVNSRFNGYQSFLVPPDGSSEDWTESDEGDGRRDALIRYLMSKSGLDWLEIRYGDEAGETGAGIMRNSDASVDDDDTITIAELQPVASSLEAPFRRSGHSGFRSIGEILTTMLGRPITGKD